MWVQICFWCAVVLLGSGAAISIKLMREPYRCGQMLSPLKCMSVSIFLSAAALFFPLHKAVLPGDLAGYVQALLLSVHSTMRLFVLDGEFDGMQAFLSEVASQSIRRGYSVLATILYVGAPALTFGFVLSFFKNVSAYRRVFLHYAADLYVFSELNEKSLFFARDIKNKHPKCLIVFTDVFENNEESIFELCEKARELKAVCFKKDITAINWSFHSKSREVFLFAIGDDDAENVGQSIRLAERYGGFPNYRLFIFSSGIESELLFQSAFDWKMRIRRINPIRALVDQTLYHTGNTYFENALAGGEKKRITVVLVGLGLYGTEMLKALTWFCQMDGYEVALHAFDQDPKAEKKFAAKCPELMSPEKNAVRTAGEAQYDIHIYSGVDVETSEFLQALGMIGPISHVFVALGSDSRNIRTAIQVRIQCLRSRQHPKIQTVVCDPLKKRGLETISDYRGCPYDIDFIGDYASVYSEDTLLNSELETVALNRHLKWGSEQDFWAYERNYRSSVAAAIHLKMRIACGIPGAAKGAEALSEEERRKLEELEHKRWNAYMRSEGYIFSGSTAAESRNDLAKMHNDLVPFSCLNEAEKRKDSQVGTA